MNSVELACSPTEYIPLDAGAKLVPIRGDCFTAVECGASAFDLACPGFVHAFPIGIIETLEEPGCNSRPVMLRKT